MGYLGVYVVVVSKVRCWQVIAQQTISQRFIIQQPEVIQHLIASCRVQTQYRSLEVYDTSQSQAKLSVYTIKETKSNFTRNTRRNAYSNTTPEYPQNTMDRRLRALYSSPGIFKHFSQSKKQMKTLRSTPVPPTTNWDSGSHAHRSGPPPPPRAPHSRPPPPWQHGSHTPRQGESKRSPPT
jgi:hypothetical protein